MRETKIWSLAMTKLLRAAALLAAIAALAAVLAACSDMERSGVSNRPQNMPADWEQQRTSINTDK